MDESPFHRLGHELDAAALRQLARAKKPGRRRRSLGLLAAIVAVPAVAASAWAAGTLISRGTPVAYERGVPVSGVGTGTAVPGSVRMLTTSIEDPDGGLPWGLRSFRTTRGLACLQIGRSHEGKLGVLGSDGSFQNDGRFHELRPGVYAHCFPPDGAGHAYLAVHQNAYLASGEPCRSRRCFVGRAVGTPSTPPPEPIATKHLRSVDFGLLGPEATRVTYRDGAHERTIAPLGDGGGYLVVGPSRKPAPFPKRLLRKPAYAEIGRFSRGFYREEIAAMTPASRVITRVQYGEQAHCDVKPATIVDGGGRTGGCPDPPGFVPITQVKPQDVRAKVTAKAVGEKKIRVRFTARMAVRDRSSAYNVMVYPPRSATRCRARASRPKPSPDAVCGGATGDGTDRDIPAGRTIVKDLALVRRTPGRYRIVVSLRTQSPHPSLGGNLQYPGTIVGRTTLVVR